MKLTLESIQQINLFEKITGAKVKDCLIEDEITFVVEEGNVKKAIGEEHKNIRRMEKLLGRKVKIIAFNSNPVKFINNLLYPIRPIKVEVEGSIALISVESSFKGKIYGRSRENLAKIKKILAKYFNIKDVQII